MLKRHTFSTCLWFDQHPDPATVRRVSEAMFEMKKLDIAALRRAAG